MSARSRAATWTLRLALTGLVALGTGCSNGGPEPADTNVIVIVVDTLRADYVHGGHGTSTPALDALAADGVPFDLAFAHAPMTLPAHTAFFSSRYPHISGTEVNGHPVDSNLPLLSAWLREAGYYTAGVVSIGTLKPSTRGAGLGRGFAHYDDETQDLPRAHDAQQRLAPVLAELPQQEPFFLFAHYSDPHTPYNAHGTSSCEIDVLLDGRTLERIDVADMQTWRHEAELEPGGHRLEFVSVTPTPDDPESDLQRFTIPRLGLTLDQKELPFSIEGSAKRTNRLALVFDNDSTSTATLAADLWIHETTKKEDRRERYRFEVEYVDRAIGDLITALKRLGLYEDSLIVFTSDHGEGLGDHDHPGHVRYLYDEAIRVPLIVKLPRDHPAEERLRTAGRALARHIDVVPTVLDVVGVRPLPGQMGSSLLQDEERVHFAETRENEAPQDLVAFRSERHKLIYRVRERQFEMYDLLEDPGELNDVFASQGDRLAPWQAQLQRMGSRSRVLEAGELDAETRANLEALGYLGGDE